MGHKKTIKEKNDKLYYIKILRAFYEKILKVKRQATEWGGFVMHRFNEGL